MLGISCKCFLPTLNKILVKIPEQATKSQAGIIVSNAQENNLIGEVMAVGPGILNKAGTLIPACVKKGDKVLMSRIGGERIFLKEGEFKVIRDDDIIGVIKPE